MEFTFRNSSDMGVFFGMTEGARDDRDVEGGGFGAGV